MKLLPSFTGQPEPNRIYHTEFFELCGAMDDNSVDMILCDLPYGTTACSWDKCIPLEPMWAAFKRIIKPNGAIVLTASEPFSFILGASNLKWFRHSWVVEKTMAVGFLNCNVAPMKAHETILVFSDSMANYYPQMTEGSYYKKINRNPSTSVYQGNRLVGTLERSRRFPRSIIKVNNAAGTTSLNHPTQKPVALFEYLIKTYTLPDQLVFDPCVGSGTTAVAAHNTGRNYICGDMMLEYVEIARKRVNPVFGDPPKRKREVLTIQSLPLFEAIGV